MKARDKTDLLETVEDARRQIAELTVEDIDRVELLLKQMREVVDTLIAEGNPYALNAEEITALQTVYAGASGDIELLAERLASGIEKLNQSGAAAAAYLKNS